MRIWPTRGQKAGDLLAQPVAPDGLASSLFGDLEITVDVSAWVIRPSDWIYPCPRPSRCRAQEHEEGELDQTCMVTDVTGARMSLSCTDAMGQPAPHTLDIVAPISAAELVDVGTQVQFYMLTFVPWWGDLYVTLRDDVGRLLLGYMSAGFPFEGCCRVQPSPAIFDPVVVVRVGDVCEPDCAPETGFIVDPCPCYEREAFDFTTADDATRVYDKGAGEVGTTEKFALTVERAGWSHNGEGSCIGGPTDTPGGWYTFIIMRS